MLHLGEHLRRPRAIARGIMYDTMKVEKDPSAIPDSAGRLLHLIGEGLDGLRSAVSAVALVVVQREGVPLAGEIRSCASQRGRNLASGPPTGGEGVGGFSISRKPWRQTRLGGRRVSWGRPATSGEVTMNGAPLFTRVRELLAWMCCSWQSCLFASCVQSTVPSATVHGYL